MKFRTAKAEDDAEDGEGAGADSGGVSAMGTAEMREALIPLLLEEETVVQAIRRLGKKGGGASDGAQGRRSG